MYMHMHMHMFMFMLLLGREEGWTSARKIRRGIRHFSDLSDSALQSDFAGTTMLVSYCFALGFAGSAVRTATGLAPAAIRTELARARARARAVPVACDGPPPEWRSASKLLDAPPPEWRSASKLLDERTSLEAELVDARDRWADATADAARYRADLAQARGALDDMERDYRLEASAGVKLTAELNKAADDLAAERIIRSAAEGELYVAEKRVGELEALVQAETRRAQEAGAERASLQVELRSTRLDIAAARSAQAAATEELDQFKAESPLALLSWALERDGTGAFELCKRALLGAFASVTRTLASLVAACQQTAIDVGARGQAFAVRLLASPRGRVPSRWTRTANPRRRYKVERIVSRWKRAAKPA